MDQETTPAVDSRVATFRHIEKVRNYLNLVIAELLKRSARHDQTKLVEPELSAFDAHTPALAALTYESEEYKRMRNEVLKTALTHHYANNSHHPEHYPNGIKGMDLFDIVEMFCDWRAASERHANGNLRFSIEENQKRFNYSDDLKQIMLNSMHLFNSSL